jgi:hypothetical protein
MQIKLFNWVISRFNLICFFKNFTRFNFKMK